MGQSPEQIYPRTSSKRLLAGRTKSGQKRCWSLFYEAWDFFQLTQNTLLTNISGPQKRSDTSLALYRVEQGVGRGVAPSSCASCSYLAESWPGPSWSILWFGSMDDDSKWHFDSIPNFIFFQRSRSEICAFAASPVQLAYELWILKLWNHRQYKRKLRNQQSILAASAESFWTSS